MQFPNAVPELCRTVTERLERIHIGSFRDYEKKVLLISEAYPGVWLEHLYDSVFYAELFPDKLFLAENTVELFCSLQRKNGQLPCYVWDGNRLPHLSREALVGYGQTQECVSFGSLCLKVYEKNQSRSFLSMVYSATQGWVRWLKENRMTQQRGLIEQFVGYDTGHDNSPRGKDLFYPGAMPPPADAATPPANDRVAPILAVDMNCNYFGNLKALSAMAALLGKDEEAKGYEAEAQEVKQRLFALCFDREDAFFYDVDRNGAKRKMRSCTLFHLFMEGVLDPAEDKALIQELRRRHLEDPEAFATPYPYPSMALNDPCAKEHDPQNSWGYFSQGLLALRSTLWMERYGFCEEHLRLCRQWLKAWTEHYEAVPFGQELDPVTGIPSPCSQYYSSTMLFYLYAARRLNEKEKEQ